MNDRIKELAREVGLLTYNPEGTPTKLENFAELIIKECARIADVAEPYKANDSILSHFGIRE